VPFWWDSVFKEIHSHLKSLKAIPCPLFAHVRCFPFISMFFFPILLHMRERETEKKWYRAHFEIHESWILPKFQQDYREISSGKYYVLFLSLLKLLHNLTACGIVPHFKVKVYKHLAWVQHSSPYGPQCLQHTLSACTEWGRKMRVFLENYGNLNNQAHFHDSLTKSLSFSASSWKIAFVLLSGH